MNTLSTSHTAGNVGKVLALLVFAMTLAEARAQFSEPGTVVLRTLTGEANGDQFGWVSEDLGDLTGDGVHEFVITSPGHDSGGNNAGRVYVYNGATGVLVFPAITGTTAGERFGASVGAPGDVNSDGVRDVLIGAPSYQGTTGRVAVHSGVDGSEIYSLTGAATLDNFGYDVAGIGDMDGDGHGDFIVGAPGHDAVAPNAGRAYIYSGASGSLICVLDGETQTDRMGDGVQSAPDVTGDGIPDPIVAADRYDPATTPGVGRAYVFSGADCLAGDNPAPLFTLDPPAPATRFGQWFLDAQGDVDNDGTYDYYISDYNANRAHVYSGATGALIRTYSGDGNGGFGIGRMAGDVDGDGWEDMLLAAWASSVGATGAGKAFVYSGRTSAVLQTYTHTVANSNLGFDANSMGDVNGDGRIDHLLTAASYSSSRGRVYLVAGNVEPFSVADLDLDGDQTSADMVILEGCLDGPLSAPPGGCDRADINADGYSDLRDFALFQAAFVAP